MKKLFFIVVAAVLMVGGLASCNTEGNQYAESIAERMNQERTDQGIYAIDTVMVDGDEVVAVIDMTEGSAYMLHSMMDDDAFLRLAHDAMAEHSAMTEGGRDSLVRLAEYGYGIGYRITNHEDVVEISFSPDEVKEIFGNK